MKVGRNCRQSIRQALINGVRIKTREETLRKQRERLIGGKEEKKAEKVMSLSCSAKYPPQLRVSLITGIRFQDRFGAECGADLTVLNPSGLYQGTDGD